MLPSPTAEMFLQLADIRERFGANHVACATHLRGMLRRLSGAPRSPPDIWAAEEGARDTLAALCATCANRTVCRDRVMLRDHPTRQ